VGLYGGLCWMRSEMDAIRLGIDVSHDAFLYVFDDLQEVETPNTDEIDAWDNS